jgi:hypothetical protein
MLPARGRDFPQRLMIAMPPDTAPPGPAASPDGTPVPTVRSPEEKPAVPVRSRDDSDVGWGERPEPDDDDERLYRERPPHWDSA